MMPDLLLDIILCNIFTYRISLSFQPQHEDYPCPLPQYCIHQIPKLVCGTGEFTATLCGVFASKDSVTAAVICLVVGICTTYDPRTSE
jgi:hypothetical protein